MPSKSRTAPVNATMSAIEAQLEQLAAEQAASAERIAKLHDDLRLARGTGNVTAEAAEAANRARQEAAAPAPPAVVGDPQPLASLSARMLKAMSERVMSLDELVLDTGGSAGRVSQILKTLRASRQVYNLGAEDRPRYVHVIGDETDTSTLAAVVEAIVRERPTTLQEIVEATRANRNRISGVLAKMTKREQDPVINFGAEGRAKWFIPPRHVRVLRAV